MFVYRITPLEFASDLSGTGSKLFGGRWNNKGTACIYTSENRALSLCEYACHVSLENMPDKIALVTYETKSEVGFTIKDLASNWKEEPAPDFIKKIGSDLFRDNQYLFIKVPSVIIEQENNLVFNPLHKDFDKFSIKSVEEFKFDARLKL
jgi:RES domain-containing protein